jgi:hypothetical protein
MLESFFFFNNYDVDFSFGYDVWSLLLETKATGSLRTGFICKMECCFAGTKEEEQPQWAR